MQRALSTTSPTLKREKTFPELLKKIFYLFIHERQRGREAGSMQGAWHGTRSRDSRNTLWAEDRHSTIEPPRGPLFQNFIPTGERHYSQTSLLIFLSHPKEKNSQQSSKCQTLHWECCNQGRDWGHGGVLYLTGKSLWGSYLSLRTTKRLRFNQKIVKCSPFPTPFCQTNKTLIQ